MRYLVFSDLHYFRGRPYILDTCQWIAQQIDADPTIGAVVFCGDLNHAHNYVETDVLHDMAAGISAITEVVKRRGVKLYAISGNHDTTLRNSGKNVIEALGSLNEHLIPITSPTTINGAVYAPYPPQGKEDLDAYMVKLEAAAQGVDLMFSHFELADIRYTPASSHTSEHPTQIPQSIKFVVNGHYHHPEHKEIAGKQIVLVGSPCYHTYADMLVETPRGVMVIDHQQGNFSYTRYENPIGPIFHTIETSQIMAALAHPSANRLMLRIKISTKEEYEQWKPRIMDLREIAKSVRVIGKTNETTAEIYKEETSTISSVDPASMLRSYATKKNISKELADYGTSILERVSQ